MDDLIQFEETVIADFTAAKLELPKKKDNVLNHKVVIQSITRLETFLSYLSNKIKSNTLKISAVNATNADAGVQSPTTASHSDLSIDECELNCFKDYLMNENQKKAINDIEVAQKNSPTDKQAPAADSSGAMYFKFQ